MNREQELRDKAKSLTNRNMALSSPATTEYLLENISETLARICDALERIAGQKEEIEEPKEEFNIDNESLYYVNICRKTRNALLRSGYKTVGDIRHLSIKQLMEIRNVGSSAINDIISMLAEYGIELPEYAKGGKA